MISFNTMRARAEKRKGGPKGLAKLLPAKSDTEALAKLGDDRILAEMTKRNQVVFSHSLNARGRSIASGETEVVSPAKHKRDNAEAIFS